MRKKSSMLCPAVLGVVGFALRMLQQGVFDPSTGLAAPDDFRSIAMAVYLAAVGIWLLVAALRQERGIKLGIDDGFTVPNQRMLPLLVIAMLLMGIGGGLVAYGGFLSGDLLHLVLGIFGVVACLCLFYGVALWRRGRNWGALLLAPALLCVVWLLTTYKQYADYPVMEALYVQILAVAAFTYAFYQLAAFGFDQGSRRPLTFILPAAMVLGLTVLADDLPLGLRALDTGCTVVLGGFWVCWKGNA